MTRQKRRGKKEGVCKIMREWRREERKESENERKKISKIKRERERYGEGKRGKKEGVCNM